MNLQATIIGIMLYYYVYFSYSSNFMRQINIYFNYFHIFFLYHSYDIMFFFHYFIQSYHIMKKLIHHHLIQGFTLILTFLLGTISSAAFSQGQAAMLEIKGVEKQIANLLTPSFMTDNPSSDFSYGSADENYTFVASHLYSNMIVTPKYALVGQIIDDLTLRKVNFQTKKMQTYSFSGKKQVPDIVLGDLKNGDIIAGIGQTLFILNNQTLEVKQELPAQVFLQSVSSFSFYLDPKSKESKIFIGKFNQGAIYFELKKDSTKNYTSKPMFASPKLQQPSTNSYRLFLTSLTTGVATNGCQISYWRNFNSIVDRTTNEKYLLKGRSYVAVSYDESFFVLRSNNGTYQSYTLDENYEVTLGQTVFISHDEHRKGMMTNDDQNLFVSLSNPRGWKNVVKYNLQKKQVTSIMDEEGQNNQLDFHLFDSSLDSLVTVAAKKNNRSSLQLRKISTLQLVSEFLLSFEFPILEYKLIGSVQWGLTFGLAVRTSPYYYDLEIDSKLYLFRIEGTQIVALNYSPAFVSFLTLKACYKYIVSYKNDFPKIKVLHFSNLTKAAEINASNIFDNIIRIEKNIFILVNQEMNNVFNFEESLQSKGIFYTDPFGGSAIPLIFPKRGIIYNAAKQSPGYICITKIIYNISSPSVSSIATFDPVDRCNTPLYYVPPNPAEGECNSIFYLQFDQNFYVSEHWFARYDECTKIIEKFPIDWFQGKAFGKLFISSDKRYLIILANQETGLQHFLQIRPINSLKKVIYHELFKFLDTRYLLNSYDADVTNDAMIVLHTPYTMSVIYADFINKDSPSNKEIKIISKPSLIQEE